MQLDALAELTRLIRDRGLDLVFVTGRSFSLSMSAIEEFDLPIPNAILCDVGSCLMDRIGDEFAVNPSYQREVSEKLGDWTHAKICDHVRSASLPLELQDMALQTGVKCSFNFDGPQIADIEVQANRWIAQQRAPLQMVISIDPINGVGLLDFLPVGVDKAFGLHWWIDQKRLSPRRVVFAGDSGNDTAAMTSGVCSIVVANAADSLVQAAKGYHQDSPFLWIATQPATCGVLEGLRYFTSL